MIIFVSIKIVRQLEKAKQAASQYIKHNDKIDYMQQDDQSLIIKSELVDMHHLHSNTTTTTLSSNPNVIVISKPTTSIQLANSAATTKKFKTIINPKNSLNIINISNSNNFNNTSGTSSNNANSNSHNDDF